jgi:hypothetical protein
MNLFIVILKQNANKTRKLQPVKNVVAQINSDSHLRTPFLLYEHKQWVYLSLFYKYTTFPSVMDAAQFTRTYCIILKPNMHHAVDQFLTIYI